MTFTTFINRWKFYWLFLPLFLQPVMNREMAGFEGGGAPTWLQGEWIGESKKIFIFNRSSEGPLIRNLDGSLIPLKSLANIKFSLKQKSLDTYSYAVRVELPPNVKEREEEEDVLEIYEKINQNSVSFTRLVNNEESFKEILFKIKGTF